MSAALLIDMLLWGSVFGVGLIAFRRGPPVFKASLREGSMDFINIVPRIALIRGDRLRLHRGHHPAGGDHRLARPGQWLARRRAVIAGAATPGGPVIGFSSARWR